MSLLDVRALTVEFRDGTSKVVAVEGLDLCVEAGEVVGILGESGSGKTAAMLAVMGLIDAPGSIRADSIKFSGRQLLGTTYRQRQRILGKEIAMIFQNPASSLNPSLTIGYQITEAIRIHEGGTRAVLEDRALELLRWVEIPDAARRMRAFPHQLSGGMSQRVMIAIAIACGPKLLIADEPTTALDVTIQAQILDLLRKLQRESGMAMVLISHDVAVVSQLAQRAVVMYAGQAVETGTLPRLFDAPRHPYTAALLASIPERNLGRERFSAIPGAVPGHQERPRGCLFSTRCTHAFERCFNERPQLEGTLEQVRCFAPLLGCGALRQ